MSVKKYFILFKTLFLIVFTNAQPYNLFGKPGLGYLIELNLGTPPQTLKFLLDTGSSTMAVASTQSKYVTNYFHTNQSTSVSISNEWVCSVYTEGRWCGSVASDLVQIPSLNKFTYFTFALIAEQEDIFFTSSNWQGILGLAYGAIAAANSVGTAKTGSLPDTLGSSSQSFEVTLCGVYSDTKVTHYGRFQFLNDSRLPAKDALEFSTPILRQAWYEIGVLNIRVLGTAGTNSNKTYNNTTLPFQRSDSLEDTCLILNKKKSIVDCGATDIIVPPEIFIQVVEDLRNAAHMANLLILDDSFWYRGEFDCWPQPLELNMPNLAIDILDKESDNQYYTLEIPPQSYIRLVSGRNSSGSVSEFCYKFGLEQSTGSTVLGVAAMEGFQVIFNRSASLVTFGISQCGPRVNITGPHKLNTSIRNLCKLNKPSYVTPVELLDYVEISVKCASAISILFLLYLLWPCLTKRCLKYIRGLRSSRVSFSSDTLMPLET